MPAQQINKIQGTTLHENVFCIVLILILHQKYNIIVIKVQLHQTFCISTLIPLQNAWRKNSINLIGLVQQTKT